jgi:hypothetical protein
MDFFPINGTTLRGEEVAATFERVLVRLGSLFLLYI